MLKQFDFRNKNINPQRLHIVFGGFLILIFPVRGGIEFIYDDLVAAVGVFDAVVPADVDIVLRLFADTAKQVVIVDDIVNYPCNAA